MIIMIIAELSGRCRQSPIVLGGEGQSLRTKDALSIGPLENHLKPCFHKSSQSYIYIYKITMIVRALWLRGVFAWEYVNMVMASRSFTFHALITQARIWKSFQVQNSTSLLYLPIPSSTETWKIVTKKVCQFYFRVQSLKKLLKIFLQYLKLFLSPQVHFKCTVV